MLRLALSLPMARGHAGFEFPPGLWTCCRGGLRLKRDVSEYTDFVRAFKSHAVDEQFESLSA